LRAQHAVARPDLELALDDVENFLDLAVDVVARIKAGCGSEFEKSWHLGPSNAAQTSEFYEVGDACEWMDEAVADETPKAGLGEMLGPKPAFRHQRLGGFLHDGMSQAVVPFPSREHRGLPINGQETRPWSGREAPHLIQNPCFVAHGAPRVRHARREIKAGADRDRGRITRDEVQAASARAPARLDDVGMLVVDTDAEPQTVPEHGQVPSGATPEVDHP